jgi:uncharacterized membrane protein
MAVNNSGHLIWIALGALVGFASSFVFGDLLTLPVDLYYLIYFIAMSAFFTTYLKKTRLHLREWFRKRLLWGILLGLVFAAVMAQNVFSRPPPFGFPLDCDLAGF